MYQVCYSRYHVSFYLWLIGSVLKRKVQNIMTKIDVVLVSLLLILVTYISHLFLEYLLLTLSR